MVVTAPVCGSVTVDPATMEVITRISIGITSAAPQSMCSMDEVNILRKSTRSMLLSRLCFFMPFCLP